MRFLLFYITIFFAVADLYAQQPGEASANAISPLASFSTEWNKAQYEQCNTAADEKFMDAKEKVVIYILNLVRSAPKLFANTVLVKYPAFIGKQNLLDDKYYYQSLLSTLNKMEQQTLLFADEECFISAACHAQRSGSMGYMGHARKGDCKIKKHYLGECCDYGSNDPLEIVMELLIDEGIPSLGHRTILLGDYENIGVAIRKHKAYRYNTVLDLY